MYPAFKITVNWTVVGLFLAALALSGAVTLVIAGLRRRK
jgi:hypothetical protein